MIRSTVRKYLKNFVGDFGNRNLIDRQLWVEKTLKKLPKGFKLLDAGAGEQQYRQYCQHLNYVSQDFNEYSGTGNMEGFQTGTWDISNIDIVSDIINIPEPDASFDAILCTEVLEHIPDPIAAIKEFHRLLKPGGELILTAPFASLTHFAPYHYYTGFNRYFYEYFLPSIGFIITEITANGNYSGYLAQEIRRIITYFGKVPFLIKLSIFMILRFISNKSTERKLIDIGCFGFHVRAKKSDNLNDIKKR
jgi:ubiquinone/menaquinone biosynthesis C-methylase UbiE